MLLNQELTADNGNPIILVLPNLFLIAGESWGAEEEISIVVSFGSEVLLNETTASDEDGFFVLNIRGLHQLEPGHFVEVTDQSLNEKTHIVKDLEITDVDMDADKVYGDADSSDNTVLVEVRGDYEENPIVTADFTDGTKWEADFSAVGIDYSTVWHIRASEFDDEGNATLYYWFRPYFFVDHQADDIWGYNWEPEAEIEVKILYAGGGQDTLTIYTSDHGDFWVNLRREFGYVVGIDDELELTQGAITLNHVIMNLTVGGVNPVDDSVYGTADPGSIVEVEIHGHDPHYYVKSRLFVEAEANGDWTAYFEEGEIEPGAYGSAEQSYDYSAATRIHWHIPPTFTDVSSDHPFFEEIEKLVALGITTGWPDGTFRPTLPVTRQAMAAFLYRVFDLEDPGVMELSFTDVPEDHTFFAEIEALAASGIATGWPDGTFRPTLPVTRQAAAAFLFRALELEDPGVMEPTFSDVLLDHTFFIEIEALAATGITTGWPDGTFRPTFVVTRQAMAAFLIRALELDDQ